MRFRPDPVLPEPVRLLRFDLRLLWIGGRLSHQGFGEELSSDGKINLHEPVSVFSDPTGWCSWLTLATCFKLLFFNRVHHLVV